MKIVEVDSSDGIFFWEELSVYWLPKGELLFLLDTVSYRDLKFFVSFIPKRGSLNYIPSSRINNALDKGNAKRIPVSNGR